LLKAVVTASREAPTSDEAVGELVQAGAEAVLDAHLAHQGDGLAQHRDPV
jgi:hypothetical protein